MPTHLIKLLRTPACLLVMAVLLLALAAPASADAIKRGDLPLVEGVTLIDVQDGKLRYRTSVGEREAKLSEINALVIESVPAFETGLTAFKKGEMRAAQRSFESIWANTRVDWIRHYAGFYLAQVYDNRGEPVSAGQVYAKLASEGADLYFLSQPPLKSLADADADEKKRITDEILAVVAQTEGQPRERLRTYLRAVAGDTVDIPQNIPGGADDLAAKARAKSAVILPESVWKMLDRQNEPEGKWDSIKLLSEGKYKESAEEAKKRLNSAGDMPEKLFILGRAQLALADAKGDKDLYRDAGLTFMRVVVHFDRAGRTHSLVAAAQLEVAYIHKKIDREDIYNRVLFGGDDGGGVHLVIDDREDYPQYYLRYYQIIGEEPPEE